GVAGYSMTKDDYLRRLRRIEGQVRGLQRLIEEDTYCIDVLTQISAVTSALQSVAVGLLDEHLHHCVSDALSSGAPDAAAKVSEATRAIERLVKSGRPARRARGVGHRGPGGVRPARREGDVRPC